MRPIALECRKCGYFFSPIKIPKTHIHRGKLIFDTRCPRCRARSKFLRKITTKDIKVLLGFYKKEPWDLKTMEIALRLKEKETQKYQSLDDIKPDLIRIYLTQSKYYKHPKKAISWLEKKGYDPQDAHTIINLLQETFCPYQLPIKPPEPEPPVKPTRPIIPEIKPNCWGKWFADPHCRNKCDVRKSCKKEFEYQEYKKDLLPNEESQ